MAGCLQAVAAHSQRHQGLVVDPATEALITVGATEGIAAVFMALCNPGDEVRAPCTHRSGQAVWMHRVGAPAAGAGPPRC